MSEHEDGRAKSDKHEVSLDYEGMVDSAKDSSVEADLASTEVEFKPLQEVKVQRTGGEYEAGWQVVGYDSSGRVIVTKQEAGGNQLKHIPSALLSAMQNPPEQPPGIKKPSVIERIKRRVHKSENDLQPQERELDYTPRGLAVAGLRIRDLTNIYRISESDHAETELLIASTNMAEAAAILYGQGIKGELPTKLTSGVIESVNRIFDRVRISHSPPFEPLPSRPVDAQQVGECFKLISRAITNDKYSPEINQQIAFDGAMVFAHILLHPEIGLDDKARIGIQERLLRAENALQQPSQLS